MSLSESNTATDYPLSLIAAQYVLGVLSASARAQVQTRMLHDIALRDSVYQWERKVEQVQRQDAERQRLCQTLDKESARYQRDCAGVKS